MSQSFVDRMVGAARLDADTYEAVERDRGATGQALLVVLLAALAAAVGVGVATGVLGLVFALVSAIVGWALFALIAYWIGARLFHRPGTSGTWGEVLRTTGFAQSPGLLLIFAFVPLLGWILIPVVSIWILIAVVVAVRQALELSTLRAVGTVAVAWVIQTVLRLIAVIVF